MLAYNKIIPFLFLAWIGQARAYTILIVTDQQDLTKAKSDIEKLKATYPFSKFDIDFKIARVRQEQLICGASHGIDRLVTCDAVKEKLQAVQTKLGGDHTIVIKDSQGLAAESEHGGSAAVGGDMLVTTSHSHAGTALHEFMHSLGFSDEYIYSLKDAKVYCTPNKKASGNLAVITPKEPYSGDAQARGLHSSDIPWYNKISSSTLITNSGQSKLGTVPNGNKVEMKYPVNNSLYPSPFDEPTGLYESDICRNGEIQLKFWKPGASKSIMGSLSAGLGRNLEDLAEEALYRKGARYKAGLSNINEKEAKVGVLEKSNVVNDTPRSTTYKSDNLNITTTVRPAGTAKSK